MAAQYAAEATLRRVHANQKDDDSLPIESFIAPLEAEIKLYKNEVRLRKKMILLSIGYFFFYLVYVLKENFFDPLGLSRLQHYRRTRKQRNASPSRKNVLCLKQREF